MFSAITIRWLSVALVLWFLPLLGSARAQTAGETNPVYWSVIVPAQDSSGDDDNSQASVIETDPNSNLISSTPITILLGDPRLRTGTLANKELEVPEIIESGQGPETPQQPGASDRSVDPVEATRKPVSQEAIDALAKQIAAATDLSEEQKNEGTQRIKGATEWLKAANEAEIKARDYQLEIDRAPADLEKAKADLAVAAGEPQFNIAPDATLTQIEQMAAEADTKLAQARQLLATCEDAIKRRGERKTELAKLVAETAQRLEDAKKQTMAVAEGSSLVDLARRLENDARFSALHKQQELYPIEARRLDSVAELLPLRRDLAKRDVTQLEKTASGWRQIAADFRKKESDRQAAEARRQVQDSLPALKSLAEQNAQLAERRAKFVSELDKTSQEVQSSKQLADQVKTDFQRLVEKVEKVGHSSTIGLMLRRHRDFLPNLTLCQNRIRFARDEMPRINMSVLELQDERETLGDIDSATAAVVAKLDRSVKHFNEPVIAPMVNELLQAKRELLDKLIRDHDKYLQLLGELEISQRELINRTRKAIDFIDERVLWIRSSDPIGRPEFKHAWAGLQQIASSEKWAEVATRTQNRLRQRPLLLLISVVAIFVCLLAPARLKRQVKKICDKDDASESRRYFPVIQAALALFLATACWPALIWFVGWQMRVDPEMPVLGQYTGAGLSSAAFMLWILQFTIQLMRRHGLAERFFQWNAASLAVARRHLIWLTVIGIPIVFVVSAIIGYEDGQWASSIGRIGFLGGCAALTIFVHMVLRPGKGVFHDPCCQTPGAWLCRLRLAIYLLGISIPIALGTLAGLGYDYSAAHLAVRLQATVGFVLVMMVVRAIVLHLLAVRRNLAFEAAGIRPEDLGQATSGEVSAEATPVMDRNNANEVNEVVDEIERTDSQIGYLFGYAVATILFIGCCTIWSDITPALGILDQITISSKYVDVTETVQESNGSVKSLTSQKLVTTTLKHAVIASLLLLAGLILSKNLPALLQVVILVRMPIDKGQRYAAETILRYLVTLASVILACRTMGLTWSSIQWLLAAMTVGLGFGLQEIFANLVSGLILLFERPVRVGDLVTVSGTTGRVTRMQIRATTITDYDRRELIVPNKKFITDDVVNWTLTDDVNRIVIKVGIAYGSDTELARSLLVTCARQHPRILDDPEPTATFDQFGDSSLNVTLRCFLPSLENRLDAIHQLYSAIDKAFKKAKIEIAFPQQDLHIRSVDAPQANELGQNRASEAA